MDPHADELYRACRTRDEEMLRAADDDLILEIWARASEMTKRMALVLARGRYAGNRLQGAIVNGSDMTFARDPVDWSIEAFVRGLRENMAETQHPLQETEFTAA